MQQPFQRARPALDEGSACDDVVLGLQNCLHSPDMQSPKGVLDLLHCSKGKPCPRLSLSDNHFCCVLLAWYFAKHGSIVKIGRNANLQFECLKDPALRHIFVCLLNATRGTCVEFLVTSTEFSRFDESVKPLLDIGYLDGVKFTVYSVQCSSLADTRRNAISSLQTYGDVSIDSLGVYHFFDKKSEVYSIVRATTAGSVGYINPRGKGNTLYLPNNSVGVITSQGNTKVIVESSPEGALVYRDLLLEEACSAKGVSNTNQEFIVASERACPGEGWKMLADCIPGLLHQALLRTLCSIPDSLKSNNGR